MNTHILNTTQLETTSSTNTFGWLIVGCNALFLFYKYILQLFPSVMTNELMSTFHLNGAGLGNLAATYFYSFFIAQLFSGYILDRYSPRFVTTLAIALCAAGVACFAHSSTLLSAILSRMLIGVGVSFATVSYLKQVTIWFPPQRLAFVGGLLATAVGIGALVGQAPLAHLVNALDWRRALSLCAMLGVIIAAIYLWLVRDKKETNTKTTNPINLQAIKAVLSNRRNWLLTCYSGLAFSPMAVFGGLWGDPFLQTAFHLNNIQAAQYISLAFVGLGGGAPLLGWLADRLQLRADVMIAATLLSFVSLLIILVLPPQAHGLLALSLLCFGLGTGGFMLGFTVAKTLNPVFVAASVVAMINTGDALFGAVTEPFIGTLLDHFGHNQLNHGIPVFTTSNYHHALALLPVYLIVALGCAIWVKNYQSAGKKQQL